MARRVNTRFLGFFAAVAIGGVGIIVAAQKFLIKETPDQYVSAAKDADAAHQWKDSVANWSRAASISQRDPAILTSLGNALHNLAGQDPEILRKGRDRDAWERALENDPGYVPAVKSLWLYWRDAANSAHSINALRNARDRAEQLHRLAPGDPEDAEVEAYMYTTTIEAWLNGLETDSSRLDEAEEHLRDLMRKEPANADLPFVLARVDIRHGTELVRGGGDLEQPPAVTAMFKKAVDEIAATMATQDHNALMHYRAALVQSILADVDHAAADSKAQHMAKASEYMDRAMALLKGDEPRYVEVCMSAASVALSQENRPKADGIVRQLLKEHSGNVWLVDRLAGLLESIPELRTEAIETIRSALNSANRSEGMDASRFELMCALTQLQTAEYAAAPDGPAKARARAEIRANLDALDRAGRDGVRVVKLDAGLDMVDKEYISAVLKLGKAVAGDQRTAEDPDILWMLSQAYQKTGELEQARESLQKTIGIQPAFLEARKRLVEVLSSEGTEQARRDLGAQLAYLQRAAPNDPDVIRLQMVQLDPATDSDKLKILYAKLPEQTKIDQRSKASVALQILHDLKEGERLLTQAVDADPSDGATVIQLANAYAADNRRPDAVAAVEKGLAANSKDPALQVALKQLQDTPPEELRKFMNELEAHNPDIVSRELALARNAEEANDGAAAEAHFKAAEAAAPDSRLVWDRMFQFYISRRQFDKAQPYLQKLTAVNGDQANGLLYQFHLAQAKEDVAMQMDVGRRLVAQLPEFAMSYFSLGQAWQARGEYQLAIDNYDVAVQKKGDLVEGLKAKIGCYYQMGKEDAARVAIAEGRRRFPRDPDLRMMQVREEMNHGDPAVAVQALAEEVNRNPGFAGNWFDLASAQTQLAASKARISDLASANAAASSCRDTLTKAIAKFPDDARFYGQLADLLAMSNAFGDGEKVLQSLDDRPAWKGRPEPVLMLAAYLMRANQTEKAEQAYRVAYERSNHNPDAQSRLAATLVLEKKFDAALELLAGANVDNPQVRRQRVETMIAAGRVPDAEALLAATLRANPSDAADLQSLWAKVLMNARKPADAAVHADKSLEIDPKNADALLVRALLRMNQSPPDTDGALADLTAARGVSPANTDVLSALGDVYVLKNDLPQATRAMEAAVRSSPSSVPCRLRLARLYMSGASPRPDEALRVLRDGESQAGAQGAELAFAETGVYQSMGRTDDAILTCEQALRQNASDAAPVRKYLELLLSAGRYADVIRASETLAQQHKDVWWLFDSRGQARAGLNDPAGAMTELTQALSAADAAHDVPSAIAVVETIARVVSPDEAISQALGRVDTDRRWKMTLVDLYQKKGDYDAAIGVIEPMVASSASLSPADRMETLELAGLVYISAKPKPYPEKAFSIFKSLLELNPDNVVALNNLATLCADGFTPPRAEEGLGYIQHAQDVLARRGVSDPLVQDTYGWLLILNGQPGEGVSIVRRALERRRDPEGYYHLGEGYLRMNRLNEARRQADSALQAITAAQSSNQPVSQATRDKVADLSKRVLDSLHARSSVGGR